MAQAAAYDSSNSAGRAASLPSLQARRPSLVVSQYRILHAESPTRYSRPLRAAQKSSSSSELIWKGLLVALSEPVVAAGDLPVAEAVAEPATGGKQFRVGEQKKPTGFRFLINRRARRLRRVCAAMTLEGAQNGILGSWASPTVPTTAFPRRLLRPPAAVAQSPREPRLISEGGGRFNASRTLR